MRRLKKFMEGWSFTGPDKKRTEVELPHTWNALDGQDGGNDYWRGTCVYDNEFKRPEYEVGREQVYLQFNGINASAKVYVNEKEIIEHHGGYSTFRVNVTDILKDNNTIRIETDNSVNDRVYPQKADFTFYGGIYRDIEFLIVSDSHFDLDYYGSTGIKYDTKVNGADATVNVKSFLNEIAKARAVRVETELFDANGECVASGDGDTVSLEVKKVQLWDGIENPYLYTLVCSMYEGETKVDEVSCKCGIRTFEFRVKDGFYLNGRPYPLHGVSRHQDWKNIGNAIDETNMETDMQLICEVGANTIRLAHYQHNQYFYDLCDRYGMIVWAEIPYISEHLPNGRDNTISQMKELIVQNYNHPCIVTWGVSNEITISGRRYKKDMLDNHQQLQELCREMDPTRPTTLACFAMCPHWHPVAHITDLVGWNLYLGWYVPGLFLNDLWIKLWHILYPNRGLCFSEYGAEGMPGLHSSKPKRGDNTEEYQAKYHEYMIRCFRRYPFIWGTYVWNMFDFAADARDQGGEPGMNHKGLVTFDRKIKKDSFYLYKAFWSKKEFVHICGKRYEHRVGRMTEVTVYSNRDEVSLYNNGQLVAVQKGEGIFKFRVLLEKENRLEAVSGEYKDNALIFKADKLKPEYKLKKGDSSNWM